MSNIYIGHPHGVHRGFNRYREEFSLTTRPVDDNSMKYDKAEHRYILTPEYFKKKTGIDLITITKSDKMATVVLDQVSEKVYDFIYANTAHDNKANNLEIKEYLLANDPKLRDVIRKALVAYGRADAQSNISAIGDVHGINPVKGFKVDISMDSDISMQLKRILDTHDLTKPIEYRFRLKEGEYRAGY